MHPVFLGNILKQFDVIIDIAEDEYASYRKEQDDQKEAGEEQ
jgi:hypothetical protein